MNILLSESSKLLTLAIIAGINALNDLSKLPAISPAIGFTILFKPNPIIVPRGFLTNWLSTVVSFAISTTCDATKLSSFIFCIFDFILSLYLSNLTLPL